MRHRQVPETETAASAAPIARGSATRIRAVRDLACRTYHWLLWLFLVLLLLMQPLEFVWRRLQTKTILLYGRFPEEGPYTSSGSLNDEPFTDRAIVCSLVGRLFKPVQLSALLATTNKSSDSTSAPPAYRVIARDGLVLAADMRDFYTNTCDQIATTIDGMLDACTSLGYNVTGVDFLSVVASDDAVVPLPTTLPVLLLPYYDNARSMRFVIPSHDGRACVFRLTGKYLDPTLPNWFLSGVDRRAREAKTSEWLRLSHEGTWRHGWYEDPTRAHARWYSDVFSTESPGAYGLFRRQFDTNAGTESDCVRTDDCKIPPIKDVWGTDVYSITRTLWFTSVTILDENRHGIFLFDGATSLQKFSAYRLESFIGNLSVTMVLFRWLVALVATHRSGQSIGIGAVSCFRAFHIMPIALLPRLKTILTAFWTAGCLFEGDQRTMSETWFVMYPALAEFSLLQFSLLNLVAKLFRRRVSDALFGPTVLLLCLLHRLRSAIASSAWFEMSGRVTTRLSSLRYEQLGLVDSVLSARVAFDLNGRIPSLFGMKLALLAVTLVPFVLASDNTSIRSRVRAGVVRNEAEKSLALRVACSGGLGRSPVYAKNNRQNLDAIAPLPANNKTTAPAPTLLPYELARAGYVVLGRDALVSMRDWFWFMVSAPFRYVGIPMRHLRMVTFTIVESTNDANVYHVSERPAMCRVTDERFASSGAWEISVQSLQ